MSRSANPWTAAAEAWSFALACQQVVALRLARIATGGARGRREASRMVTEKVTAAGTAQIAAAVGLATGSPAAAAKKAAGVYKRAVSANNRRLRGR